MTHIIIINSWNDGLGQVFSFTWNIIWVTCFSLINIFFNFSFLWQVLVDYNFYIIVGIEWAKCKAGTGIFSITLGLFFKLRISSRNKTWIVLINFFCVWASHPSRWENSVVYMDLTAMLVAIYWQLYWTLKVFLDLLSWYWKTKLFWQSINWLVY